MVGTLTLVYDGNRFNPDINCIYNLTTTERKVLPIIHDVLTEMVGLLRDGNNNAVRHVYYSELLSLSNRIMVPERTAHPVLVAYDSAIQDVVLPLLNPEMFSNIPLDSIEERIRNLPIPNSLSQIH